MNKSNIAKVFIAVLLIAIVAVATFNYGATQRKKVSANDPTKSSLPTVKDDNSTGQQKVGVKEKQQAVKGERFTYAFPAHSFTQIRVKL